MTFEWDDDKSRKNIEKHGIGFETAKDLWHDKNRIEIEVPHPVEERWIILGRVQGKIWAAIYTVRQGSIRIISVRRARAKEVRLYEEEALS